MADPVKQFETLLTGSDFLFVVYFRGHWCPFCISWLKQLQAISGSITAVNGKTLAVTSEPELELQATRAASGYTGETIVDPLNVLQRYLKTHDLVDIAVSSKNGYDHGMAQPAALSLKKDGTVLFSWAIIPGVMNMGGAKDRPALKEVWDNVAAQLEGKPPVHDKLSLQSVTGVLKEKVFG